MKKTSLFIMSLLFITSFAMAQDRQVTRAGHATIFSETAAENITANNYEVTGTINTSTGEIAISVPVQNFQFEKALMQEHFNTSNFMDSKQFPRITFKGKIENLSSVNFKSDGKYPVDVSGELTIKGTTKPITEKAVIEISNTKVSVTSNFIVPDISSYGVGKPKGSKKNNVADNIKVTYTANYEQE